MQERIAETQKLIVGVLEKDFSHKDLGPVDDFQEAETIKNRIVIHLDWIFKKIGKDENHQNELLLHSYLDLINGTLNDILKINGRMSKLDKHTPAFRSEREQIIKDISEKEKNIIEKLYSLENDLRIDDLEKTISKIDTLKEFESNAKKSLANISQKEKEAIKALDNITDKVMRKGLKESTAHFDKLRDNHSFAEIVWLCVFIGFSVLTVGAIFSVIYWGFDTENNVNIVSSIFQRILILSAPAIFLKISLSKYHLERNLRIIYDHRATVLEQYKTFESAIGEDTEAKNKFRLEIAKYIFSDPNTGYISQSKSSEVSVNPIINMFEKASKLKE